MIDWFANTLRSYPEIAVFLSLAFGYYFGSFTYKGLGLGAVTATLIAAVIIGQLGITISGPLKPFFFLMFLFAIGYGVGPQFVRGIATDGIPQAVFAAVVCVFCLAAPYIGAKIAGYDVGSAVGLYAGSQTISASIGLATDAINRLGLSPEETKKLLDGIPVWAVPAQLGAGSSCAHSGSGRGDGLWARPRKKLRRCCPSSGCSSNVFDVAARS
jgi:putative transport protein